MIREVVTKIGQELDPGLVLDIQKSWESKMAAMKALEPVPAPTHQPSLSSASTTSGPRSAMPAAASASVRKMVTLKIIIPSAGNSLSILVPLDEAPSADAIRMLPHKETVEKDEQIIQVQVPLDCIQGN